MTTISQTAGQPASRKAAAGFFRLLGGWVNVLITDLNMARRLLEAPA